MVISSNISTVNDNQRLLQYMLNNSTAMTSLGFRSSADNSYVSYLNSLNEAYGNVAQSRISLHSARANNLLDLQQYSLRANYGLMQKQVEMSLLSSQVRERLFNTFVDMERNKLDNTFQRSKQIVQAFKY